MTAKKPRVAAVVITPPTFKASGGVSAAVQLTQRIARLIDSTLLLMAETDDETIEDGLRIVRQKAKNPLLPVQKFLPRQAVSIAWRPEISSWLRDGRFDIVHFHNPHPPGALKAAAEACMKLEIPYVISTHGFVEFNEFSRGFGAPTWQKPLLEMLVRRPVIYVAQNAARVLMLSPQEEPILTSMGVDIRNLRVVSNGVDPFFAKAIPDAERQNLIARFDLPSNRSLMLYVGNHTANKGLDVLLRALPLMQEKSVAVVAGAIRSQEEHVRLLADTGVAGSDKRVLFTDFITREELRALYQTADLFVFPSRADTLPLVILEAMASRLPVVSTAIGGIPFEVPPEAGILMKPGDPVPLAAALDRLCADPSLRRTMGDAGRARVMKIFNWEKSAEQAVTIYEEILGKGSRT
ncbi:glycosyltransferase family 4 protein [Bradyrhizobium diazoefficiens]|nr:glycosyltransferase family 4 protein [Bradyrhizobium diazoefficiens]MBR0704831.1 glycosyltransferase family 4 protein [Bradyrhizobium diazoefficiens]MBR0773180.1 glycosyltransferase family 4 protein [Bradyrhizobium diazoefficiens]